MLGFLNVVNNAGYLIGIGETASGGQKYSHGDVVLTSVVFSLTSIFWIFLGLAPFYGLVSLKSNETTRMDFLFIVCMATWHFIVFMLMATRAYAWFALAGAAIILIPLACYPSEIAAHTLRFLRLGGGIPISFIVKLPAAPGLPSEDYQLVSGCLVLWVGSQITVQIPRDGNRPIPTCSTNPRAVVDVSGVSIASEIITLNRVDVSVILRLDT